MAEDTVPIAKNQMQRSLLKIIYDYPKEKDKQKIWQYMLSHGFRSDEFADLIGKNQSEWD